MKTRQRKMLADLCGICNDLGGLLDGTSTNTQKYIDRQRALMKVYTVIYGVLTDDPFNEFREQDIENALKALTELELLAKKQYPDKNGF